jgi:hypothetical protein
VPHPSRGLLPLREGWESTNSMGTVNKRSKTL